LHDAFLLLIPSCNVSPNAINSKALLVSVKIARDSEVLDCILPDGCEFYFGDIFNKTNDFLRSWRVIDD